MSLPDLRDRATETRGSVDLPPYGSYAGVSVRDLKDDIKRLVDESDPRRRRIREAHTLMEVSKRKVWANKPEVVMKKMEAILSRPYAELKLIPKYRPMSEKLKESAITVRGLGGEAMVEQNHKGYVNFYTSAIQAVAFY